MKPALPIHIQAPAKINIGLEVIGRRKDGYHTINTIFQTVNLYDHITIHGIHAGIQLTITGPYSAGIPSDTNNIAVRAARAVLKALHETRGVYIRLTKNIPAGAGLGGGSSDAAAIIKYLPRLFNKKINPKKQHIIARTLGADVPFFLCGGCAQGIGIGDKLFKINNKSTFYIILVYPHIICSTPDIYARIELKNVLTNKKNINNITNYLKKRGKLSFWGTYLVNDLEQGAQEKCPELIDIRQKLFKAGAPFVCMSGSGSSYCGFASSFKEALSIKNNFLRYFSGNYPSVWILKPVCGSMAIRRK